MTYDLFAAPERCEGCGKPDTETVESAGALNRGVVALNGAYIRWVYLLNAYVCEWCLQQYTRWREAETLYDAPELWNENKPACVKTIEARDRKAREEAHGV